MSFVGPPLHQDELNEEDSSEEEQNISDAIFDLEDIDVAINPGKKVVGRSVSYSGPAVKRTGIEAGNDPLSLLAKTTEEEESGEMQTREEDEEEQTSSDRRLAREIEMYMEHVGSPRR